MPPSQAIAQQSDILAQVGERIRERIDRRNGADGFHCQGELLCGIQMIPAFYESRRFVPFWLDSQGLKPVGLAMVRQLQQVDADGLRPADYHLDTVTSLLDVLSIPDGALTLAGLVGAWADLELLLTDAFLLLSAHLTRGRVNPETLHADWVLTEHTIDVVKILQMVVAEAQLFQIIEGLQPSHRGYDGLRTALGQMRERVFQGGWPLVPAGPTLKVGDQDVRVVVLRHRMVIGGDLPSWDWTDTPERFDEALQAAVMRFQQRHGLTPDGLVGRKTLQAMNVTALDRLRQIELNLERWRWLPNDLGERYIIVNTADFDLRMVADGRIVMQMRVVVGRPHRKTPVFSSPLTHLVLNPQWNVPFTNMVEDMLPRIREDVGYLAAQGIKVYRGWDADSPAIDPWEIDWSAYNKRRFPFRFVQESGPLNALGRIQFMLPNKFAVFLHDTPSRNLFGRVQRDFSSGCIRMEDAFGLARLLLSEDPAWPPEKLRAALDNGRRRVVPLKSRIPVHLLYMTAWVDDEGVLQFREDIYERDGLLAKALGKRLPTEGIAYY
ncbi:MAG: L,D-transpeptidase family protein [Desulfatitalea sp.]|nr:L,D-transpeptidase family protein [Desulfatitalea sp.]